MDVGYQCPVCTVIYRSYDQVMAHIRTHMDPLAGVAGILAPVDNVSIVGHKENNNNNNIINNGNDDTLGISIDHSEYSAGGSLDVSIASPNPGSKADKKSKQRSKQQQHKSSRSLSPSAAADMEGEPADGQGRARCYISRNRNKNRMRGLPTERKLCIVRANNTEYYIFAISMVS